MSDIATPGPIDPNSGQPDHHAEVSAVKSWFRENLTSLVITAAVIGLVYYYLDPIDTLKVVIGLGLVIFIHELGHFLAAKWCDVHVKTFSIGFGPAVPFCSYKWGETTYMVGIIPLGGYVSMVGEGTGETGPEGDPDDDDNDPRSFKNKSVGKRMIIISAGVIMNVILGIICFMAAYMHGVQEKPATVGWVESGSAAWKAGMRTDDDITKIASRENPFFNDIRPVVMSTLKGEQVDVTIRHPDGSTETVKAEPQRDEGVPFPQLGIAPPYRLTLPTVKRPGFKPYVPGSPAANATPTFEPGDQFVATSDPDAPGNAVTDLPPDREGRPDYNAFYKRMVRLGAEHVVVQVRRKGEGERVSITVAPAFRADLGLRMQMGEVVAVRRGSPAEKAGVKTHAPDGSGNGDKIAVVKLPPTHKNPKETWYVSDRTRPEYKAVDPEKVALDQLDPVLLPHQLNKWSDDRPTSRAVKLIVLRQQEHNEDHPVELSLEFDPSFRYDRDVVNLTNSPLPLSGLGLAYWVEPVVNDVVPGSPAAAGGVQAGDRVTDVRFKALDRDGNLKDGDWDEVHKHQWASVDAAFQSRPPFEIDVKVKRQGDVTAEMTLKGRPDSNFPSDDRGFVFQPDYRVQKAENIGHALNLGWWRTVRFVREVYMNLYGMIRGRISAKTMSGPLTIAQVSYKFAGEDFWQFLLFLGMISVNLAVVNFLPIPVLDGGHMVFLILEKILGRPVPERLFAIGMYIGLFLILSLMVFVLYLDVTRIFF